MFFEKYRLRELLILLFLILVLPACNAQPQTDSQLTPTISGSITATVPAATSTPSATPTLPARMVYLLSPPGADTALAAELETLLTELAQDDGMRFELRQSLSPAEITPQVAVVVAMPPDPGLAALATAADQTQFVGIGIPELQPAGNLSLIEGRDGLLSQQAFLAGYLAAVVSEDWRVAVVAPAGTKGEVARQAYRNGVVFFCGLCSPAAPPFIEYPVVTELPPGASSDEQQALVENLLAQFVEIVFVAPGVDDPALLEKLAGAGIKLIGNGTPPDSVQAQWLAAVQPDLPASLAALWPDLIAGIRGADTAPVLQVTHRNAELFSPGRQRLVDETLADLTAGYIDPGTDNLP